MESKIKTFSLVTFLVAGFVAGIFYFSNALLSKPATQGALPQCVDHGQTCVIGGTPCCDATDTCSGKFPNTYCQ